MRMSRSAAILDAIYASSARSRTPPCAGIQVVGKGGPREGHVEGRAEESDDGEEREEIREAETNPASFSALNSTETSRIPLRDPARFPDLSSSHNKPLPCWARH